ncbi:MAG: CinA family protein, partial [Myroides sp.]|nr:CinA family protein [Myroides sp.]
KIIPLLVEKLKLQHIVNQVVSVVDFPESLLSQTIEKWELALPKHITLSYLPIGNRIKLRLTAFGKNKAKLEEELQEQIALLKPYISDKVISWNGNDIQEILRDILTQRKMTLSTAESCTGGKIANLITSVSGSSQFFIGGIIPYETEKKTQILGVLKELIDEKTVVSAEVAQAMSLGCQQLFDTDIAISTTGVAGPNSDVFQSEVGTVFYSIRINDFEETKTLFLPHLERTDFIDFVSQKVLQDLIVALTFKS